MKLYTKTGDDGSTGLLGKRRVSKDALRIEACGAVDEFNSHAGLAAVVCRHESITAMLQEIQHHLFDLGAELATPAATAPAQPPPPRIGPKHIAQAEQHIDTLSEQVPPLEQFILPGGCELAARLHVARSVCRRAERRCVTLAGQEPVSPQAIVYINRLSDLLFVMARRANQLEGVADVKWNPAEI